MEEPVPIIREAAEPDADLLADIVRRAFADVAKRFGLTAENCPRHPSHCTAGWIHDGLAHGTRFFVMQSGQEVTGCVGMTVPAGNRCELVRLAVPPEHRRRGIGRRLVRHVLIEAQKLGLAHVELYTIAAHTELRQWYERMGFRTRGESRPPQLPFAVACLVAPVQIDAETAVLAPRSGTQ